MANISKGAPRVNARGMKRVPPTPHQRWAIGRYCRPPLCRGSGNGNCWPCGAPLEYSARTTVDKRAVVPCPDSEDVGCDRSPDAIRDSHLGPRRPTRHGNAPIHSALPPNDGAQSVSLCDDAANRARSRRPGKDCASVSRDCPRTWLRQSEPLHISVSPRNANDSSDLSFIVSEFEPPKAFFLSSWCPILRVWKASRLQSGKCRRGRLLHHRCKPLSEFSVSVKVLYISSGNALNGNLSSSRLTFNRSRLIILK